MMSAERVSESKFSELRDEWTALLRCSRSSTPVLTWEWLWTWWESYKADTVERELYLLRVEDEAGKLTGLAPLVLRTVRQYRISLARIESMGTGEAEADETCSEYLDIIARKGSEADVAEAVAAHLRDDPAWDEILLKDVRTDNDATAWELRDIVSGPSFQFRVSSVNPASCPMIQLPESWNEYLAGLSANSRKQLRYKRKRLDDAAVVKFYSVDSLPEIKARWSKFKALHAARWQDEGKSGCFASQRFSSFLEQATERLAAGSQVQLSCLEAGGEIIAIYHLLKYGNALFYYNSGVDPHKLQEHSPGAVCLGYAIEEAIEKGVKEFHFYKGSKGSYKHHWTDQFVPVASLRIRRKNLKMWLISMFERLHAMARGVEGP